jgi:murein L,D-transpeptidase YafK
MVKLTPAVLAGSAGLVAAGSVRAEDACDATDRRVIVRTEGERLLLCDRSTLVASFGVHLGRGGVEKKRHGDNKVPIGVYSLGQPRKSEKFWMFIPIGYPTPEQRKKGYTGRDVGVHGPIR